MKNITLLLLLVLSGCSTLSPRTPANANWQRNERDEAERMENINLAADRATERGGERVAAYRRYRGQIQKVFCGASRGKIVRAFVFDESLYVVWSDGATSTTVVYPKNGKALARNGAPVLITVVGNWYNPLQGERHTLLVFDHLSDGIPLQMDQKLPERKAKQTIAWNLDGATAVRVPEHDLDLDEYVRTDNNEEVIAGICNSPEE
jgi:hypothetical protein